MVGGFWMRFYELSVVGLCGFYEVSLVVWRFRRKRRKPEKPESLSFWEFSWSRHRPFLNSQLEGNPIDQDPGSSGEVQLLLILSQAQPTRPWLIYSCCHDMNVFCRFCARSRKFARRTNRQFCFGKAPTFLLVHSWRSCLARIFAWFVVCQGNLRLPKND